MTATKKSVLGKPAKSQGNMTSVVELLHAKPETLAAQRRTEVIRGVVTSAKGLHGAPAKTKAAKAAAAKRAPIVEFTIYQPAQTTKPAKKANGTFRVGMPASTNTKLSAATLGKIAARFGAK